MMSTAHSKYKQYNFAPKLHIDEIDFRGICLNPHPAMVSFVEKNIHLLGSQEWYRLRLNPLGEPIIRRYSDIEKASIENRFNHSEPVSLRLTDEERDHGFVDGWEECVEEILKKEDNVNLEELKDYFKKLDVLCRTGEKLPEFNGMNIHHIQEDYLREHPRLTEMFDENVFDLEKIYYKYARQLFENPTLFRRMEE